MTRGQRREVIQDSMDAPEFVEAYTIPEAAEAIGKAELTFKRWIYDGLIPAPILKDAMRGTQLYSIGELQTLASILVQHEREFAYLTNKHDVTVNQIHQAMQGYRAVHL